LATDENGLKRQATRRRPYAVLAPELDIAIEESRANLIEALTLLFETASPAEIAHRAHSEVFVTQVEVPVGSTPGSFGHGGLPHSRIKRIRGHRIMQERLEATTITVPVPLF
jgi:hypothetical protein